MRIELIHPMLVHFPIALLLTAAVLKVIGYCARRCSFYGSLLFCSRLILTFGVIFAWIAICAGELAADVVGKNLCLPQVLANHSLLAYTTAYLFTVGLLLDLARLWNRLAALRKWLVILSSVALLLGTCTLLATAYLGGKMVYEQGAAVEKNCSPAQ